MEELAPLRRALLGNSTHQAARGLQLSVRNTLEVLLAAAVVFGAVAHGSEGRQEVLHRFKVSGHHGFFSSGDKDKHSDKH